MKGELLRIIDSRGRRVVLEHERWDHIREKHPEIDIDDVTDALQEATQCDAGNYPGSELLIAEGPGPARFMVVVVEKTADGARVVTAHARSRSRMSWRILT